VSIQAVAWVLQHEHRTKGTARLVLIALANYANHQHECWPSLRSLARGANVVEDDTVRRALRQLEELGVVTCVRRGAPDHRIPQERRTNLYRLHLVDEAAAEDYYPLSPGDGTPLVQGDRTPPASGGTPSPASGGAPPQPGGQTVIEPSVEPLVPLPVPGKVDPTAQELAVSRWEQSKVKPVCGFVALRARIGEALEAGYTREQLEKVLPRMTTFSRNAFDFKLGGLPVLEDEEVQRSLPGGRVELPPVGDQERRALPAGEVVL